MQKACPFGQAFFVLYLAGKLCKVYFSILFSTKILTS